MLFESLLSEGGVAVAAAVGLGVAAAVVGGGAVADAATVLKMSVEFEKIAVVVVGDCDCC